MMRTKIIFTLTFLALFCHSCSKELAPVSVAGYIDKVGSNQTLIVEVTDSAEIKLESVRRMSFLIDDNTNYESNGLVEGNIVEVIFQPNDEGSTPVAINIITNDSYPRALGRWTNGEHNKFRIDIELLPNGNIRQMQPSQTVEFKQWQLTTQEDTIQISGEVSLPPIIEERSQKATSKTDRKKADEQQEILPPARRKMEFTTTAAIGIDGDRRTLTILTDKKGQSVLYRSE